MGKWYAGVVHSHTNRSDGIFTPAQLVHKAREQGLDFIMITDHNRFCEELPKDDKVLVIPGTELTVNGYGHTNIWGLKFPIDNFECATYEEWERKVAMAKEKGAVVCINHPKCSNCGWHWPLEPEKADCVEVWNSPQHTDNMICTRWWQEELRKGKKIPAVGGSDYHRDYYITNLLTNPTSYVYAEECTQEAILKAIQMGRVTVAPKVNGQMIEITSGKFIIGDTVPFTAQTKFTVKVNCLKKGHTLKIIDNDGERFVYTAKKTAPFTIELPVQKAGFVCAQTEYTMSPILSFIYSKLEKKLLHAKPVKKVPAFIYAQTSAIYFE